MMPRRRGNLGTNLGLRDFFQAAIMKLSPKVFLEIRATDAELIARVETVIYVRKKRRRDDYGDVFKPVSATEVLLIKHFYFMRTYL